MECSSLGNLCNNSVFKEKICPVCGKYFLLPPENTYKLRIKDKVYHYCSYTCFRKVQKEIEQAEQENKSKKERNKRKYTYKGENVTW